jgi:hypothetical protein
MAETVAAAEQAVAERGEAESKPEERAAAKAVRDAVAVADALSSESVVRAIGELKSTIGRTLTQLADRLEDEVAKYTQIQRAIAAKDAELKEIYEIQRSASTLLALIETNQRQREEADQALTAEQEQLQREIETCRAAWEQERKQQEQEAKEREATEQKRRQREQEEYKYAFAREQQRARDQFQDESAKDQKELAERKAQLERDWAEREKSLAAREEELAALRARAAGFAQELESAASKAAAAATERAAQQHEAAQQLLRREHEGERNVLAAKIAALERTVEEQAAQLARLGQQAEKAYVQVQEIAVRAIEGSASAKQLAHLQQLLADQVRKPAATDR